MVARERRINAEQGDWVVRSAVVAIAWMPGFFIVWKRLARRLARFSCRGGSLLFQEGNLAIDASTSAILASNSASRRSR